MRRALLLLVVLLIAATPGLQGILDRAVARGLPGLQACVTGPDFGWVGVAGKADARRKVTPTTRFRIASSSKTMVATTALLLIGDGRLALDDRVVRFLPPDAARHFSDKITVRMLMNHTSGLEDYYDDDFDEKTRQNPRREWTHLEALEYAYELEPVGRPGGKHYYSNTNYLLLGAVIEKVTGEPLGATLQKRLFTPLGMRHTYSGLFSKAPPETAHGYAEEGDISFYNPGDGLADGGILSTAPDMAIFLRALIEKRILKPAQQKSMMTWVDEGQYGLGLMRWETEDGYAYGHSGSIGGYRSEMWYYEESGIVAVTLTNTDTKNEIFDDLTDNLEAAARED